MTVFRIGTYNVQNLFDRFDDPYSTGDDLYGKFSTTPKSRAKLYDIGRVIRENGVPRQNQGSQPYPVDILALQEVENFGALLDFVQASVGPEYGGKTGIVSQPSNDPRGIDLGVLVRSDIFRIGRVISHRFNKFRRSDGRLYQFGRDCLQVEIVKKDTGAHFLTLFNCHFKSKFTAIDQFAHPEKYAEAQELNSIKRAAEVEEVIRIVSNAVDIDNDLFAVLGDFNDTPSSLPLRPLLKADNELGLTNAVTLLEQEDLADSSAERRPRDTHHWDRPVEGGGTDDDWAQIDYILCSRKLWELKTGIANVANVPKEQGSDHYLSCVEFEMT